MNTRLDKSNIKTTTTLNTYRTHSFSQRSPVGRWKIDRVYTQQTNIRINFKLKNNNKWTFTEHFSASQ